MASFPFQNGGRTPLDLSSSSLDLHGPHHQVLSGESGPIRIVVESSPVPSSSEDELTTYKSQIYRYGSATCPHSNCKLSFLSLAGIVAHRKNCSGYVRNGDFVTCSYCGTRYCQFRSLQTHMERNHGVPPVHRSRTYEIVQQQQRQEEEPPKPLFNEQESKEMQSRRIMRESRLISTARPRGRPVKRIVNEPDANQEVTINGQRYVVVNVEPEPIIPSSSVEYPISSPEGTSRVQTSDGRWLLVRQITKDNNPSTSSPLSSPPPSSPPSPQKQQQQQQQQQSSLPIESALHHSRGLNYAQSAVSNKQTSHVVRTYGGSLNEQQHSAVKDEDVEIKRRTLEEQKAKLEAYEEVVRRSERLAENAKSKVREKTELLNQERDLRTWEEELILREERAQREINQALQTLEGDGASNSRSSSVNADASYDYSSAPEDFILPDSTRSVRSASSNLSASSPRSISGSEDFGSNVVPIRTTRSISANLVRPPSTASSSSTTSVDVVKTTSDQGTSTDQENVSTAETSKARRSLRLTSSRLTASKKKKRQNKTSHFHKQLRNILTSIDSSLKRVKKENTTEDESKGLKIPSKATPSNLKRTLSGVKYILPSKPSEVFETNHDEEDETRSDEEITDVNESEKEKDEDEVIENMIDKSRNELISELIITNSDDEERNIGTPKRPKNLPPPRRRTLIEEEEENGENERTTEQEEVTDNKGNNHDDEEQVINTKIDKRKGRVKREVEKKTENKRGGDVRKKKKKTTKNEDNKIDKKKSIDKTTDHQETPSESSRTRKRTRPVDEIEDETTPQPSKRSKRLAKKTTPLKESTPITSSKIRCGKCDAVYRNLRDFRHHAGSVHGGLARPFNESQDFSEEEIDSILKDTFKWCKRVLCYLCEKSSFTTKLGLQYHVKICGKTKEEIEAQKEQCPHCSYKGLPNCLRSHLKSHSEAEPSVKPERNEEDKEETPDGRVRRSAAKRAKVKVIEAMSNAIDDDDKDEDDKDDYEIDNDIIKDKYEKFQKLFKCKTCKATLTSKKSIKSHIVSKHPDQVTEDQDDDYDDDNDEDEIEDDDDDDEEEVNLHNAVSSTPSRPSDHASLVKNQVLIPSIKTIQHEHKFRTKYYAKSEEIFFCENQKDGMRIIIEDQVERYLPSCQVSMEFKSIRKKDDHGSSSTTLKRFESAVVNDVPTFFAGGPIWAAEWAPTRRENQQYLILSTHRDMKDTSVLYKLDSGGKGLIQIWTIDPSSSILPKFSYGIAHDYGKIWCLSWCPSGTETTSDVGLVAAACSDGNVYVHRIRKRVSSSSSKSSLPIYQQEPDFTLRPLKESLGQCLKVVWYKIKPHRVIAASYSSGNVALYDIMNRSSLLRQNSTVFPYSVIQSHYSSVNGLDLDGTESFPHYLVTGSSDRTLSMWDLSDASMIPLTTSKKGFISDLHFFRHYPGGQVSVSQDDVYLQSHTQTFLLESGYFKVRTQPILCQNAAIRSQSYNPWLGSLVVGSSAGQVIIFVSPTASRTLENDRYTLHRRCFLFRTEIEDKIDEPNDDIEPLDSKTLKYIDMNLKDFKLIPESERMAVRQTDKLQMEDITQYPIASVNRISFNPNLRYCTWIFTGGQNGIARILDIEALKHPSVVKTIEQIAKFHI